MALHLAFLNAALECLRSIRGSLPGGTRDPRMELERRSGARRIIMQYSRKYVWSDPLLKLCFAYFCSISGNVCTVPSAGSRRLSPTSMEPLSLGPLSDGPLPSPGDCVAQTRLPLGPSSDGPPSCRGDAIARAGPPSCR